MKKLIWISSYPKSGNTWIRYFLSNYFYNKKKLNLDLELIKKIGKFPSQRYLNQYANIDELQKSAYNISKYWSLSQEYLNNTNEDFLFIKNHNALVSVEGRNLTEEKYSLAFIYIVRDPRDVAVSYSNFEKNINIDQVIERMISENLYCNVSKKNPFDIEVLGSWKFNYFSWKNGVMKVPRILIRYEDLVTNTFKTKLKLIKFLSKVLGLAVDQDQIKFSIAQSDFKRLKELENTSNFDESPGNFFNSGKIGQWKKHLSLEQIKKIENFCKSEMKELNYL